MTARTTGVDGFSCGLNLPLWYNRFNFPAFLYELLFYLLPGVGPQPPANRKQR